MGILGWLRSKPKQPDLGFAADGYYPIALMQANNIDVDLYAAADAHAASLLKAGCTVHQAHSAQWGGVSAIGQDLNLFNSFATSFDETMAEMGAPPFQPQDASKARWKAAATSMVVLIMKDAPGEYERFLRYINA